MLIFRIYGAQKQHTLRPTFCSSFSKVLGRFTFKSYSN